MFRLSILHNSFLCNFFYYFIIQFALSIIVKLESIHSMYSLNKKESICSLLKEWILEKSKIEFGVNILCYSLILEWPQGSLGIPEWSLRSLQNEWITHVHSKFTLISLFSKIHSLKSEQIFTLFCLESTISMILDSKRRVKAVTLTIISTCIFLLFIYIPHPLDE